MAIDQADSSTRATDSRARLAQPSPPSIPDHELLRLIGKGSYGEVWLARNVLGNHRAVKVIHRQSFDGDRPFEREFEGIRRFEPISRLHDSQVDILHVGRNDDRGYFYYVMELADDGSETRNPESETRDWNDYVPRTLQFEINRRGRLPVRECIEIGLRLTEALAHLHERSLVHRDIKPSNIIFIDGIPKLADLGLLTHTDDAGTFVGTRGFLPPEGPGQPQADIYSLGMVLYEASAGRNCREFPELPASFETFAERNELIELNEIIAKACEPDVRKRYQSAGQMHEDLALLREGKSVKRKFALRARLATTSRVAIAGVVLALALVGLRSLLKNQVPIDRAAQSPA